MEGLQTIPLVNREPPVDTLEGGSPVLAAGPEGSRSGRSDGLSRQPSRGGSHQVGVDACSHGLLLGL